MNFLTNAEFRAYSLGRIYSLIRYCKGFMKDTMLLDPAELRGLISQAIEETLPDLPESPELISEETRNNLPFELPITKRSETRAVVICLHALFKFKMLPNSFFKVLLLLPNEPEDLISSLQDLFPITSRKELRNLSYYKKKLQDHYEMKRIPTSYFNLPKPKEPLPLAYQELNSRVRCLFPLDLSELNIPL